MAHFSSGDQKSISRMHDSLALDPWLITCPDARSWFQHCTSACIPTLLSLAQRGLVDDMYSAAHSTLHRCASSCFGARKSDESKYCRYECVDSSLPDTTEGSEVGKHQVHHARLAKRRWTSCTRKSAGCIEGTILAKRRGSLRAPHHADPEVCHETCHHGRPPGLAWKTCRRSK